MLRPAKASSAPRSALDFKRNQVRALLRIYKQSHPRERAGKVRQAFDQMVRSSQN